jgi:hypothetical protein
VLDKFQFVELFKTWAAAWVFLYAVGFWLWIHSHLKKCGVRQYRRARPVYVLGCKRNTQVGDLGFIVATIYQWWAWKCLLLCDTPFLCRMDWQAAILQ